MNKSDLSIVKNINEKDVGQTIPEVTMFNNYDIIVLKKIFTETLSEYENNNSSNKGGKDMSEYITKEVFDQFEKRIDHKLSSLENKVDSLPSSSDIKVMLLENNKELAKEAKQDRNTVIGWVIGFVGLGFTVAKAFGWL
ncbi:hypothetical protein [Staphylococcus casei]|uniref:Uncharacterized protein n=1 Tax=Staphylococcus casei TaxID=201828 RepID=A0ABZ2WBW5_9STAP